MQISWFSIPSFFNFRIFIFLLLIFVLISIRIRCLVNKPIIIISEHIYCANAIIFYIYNISFSLSLSFPIFHLIVTILTDFTIECDHACVNKHFNRIHWNIHPLFLSSDELFVVGHRCVSCVPCDAMQNTICIHHR